MVSASQGKRAAFHRSVGSAMPFVCTPVVTCKISKEQFLNKSLRFILPLREDKIWLIFRVLSFHARLANVKINCQAVPVERRGCCARCESVGVRRCQMGTLHAAGGTGGRRLSSTYSQLLESSRRATKNEAAGRSSRCVRLLPLVGVRQCLQPRRLFRNLAWGEKKGSLKNWKFSLATLVLKSKRNKKKTQADYQIKCFFFPFV